MRLHSRGVAAANCRHPRAVACTRANLAKFLIPRGRGRCRARVAWVVAHRVETDRRVDATRCEALATTTLTLPVDMRGLETLLICMRMGAEETR